MDEHRPRLFDLSRFGDENDRKATNRRHRVVVDIKLSLAGCLDRHR
jgi:hypothetical protein